MEPLGQPPLPSWSHTAGQQSTEACSVCTGLWSKQTVSEVSEAAGLSCNEGDDGLAPGH